MQTIMTKTVNGLDVVVACNGSVYFPRALHDCLPGHLQGVAFVCKTPREFDAVCKQFRSIAA